MRRRGVVVASRINHSLYLARALVRMGLLSTYLGPVLFEPRAESPAGSGRRDLVRARRVAGVGQTPLHRLWAAEVATQAASRVRQPWWRHAVSATGLDLETSARSVLPWLLDGPDVLHWHTNSLRGLPRLARARGAFLVADHRALHPLEEHPDGSPLRDADVHELELADLVVVNSTVARASLAEHGVPKEKIQVVPLGVDVQATRPARPLAERASRLLFVGAIDERKSLSLVAEALPRLQARLPDVTEIAFVGPVVDHSLRARLSAADPRVTFLGPLPKDDVLDLMADSRALFLPSRSEAFGLVVPEALSVGTPVVVSSGCGAADLVTGPASGQVFPAGDVAGFVDAVEAVLSTGTAPPQLPAAATWDGYEQRIEQLYLEHVLPAVPALAARHRSGAGQS